MISKLPLSAFIIAKNEGDRIGVTIASLAILADEVIVIDSGSADNTVQASVAAGARVIFNAWPGYGMQKRFGEDQCQHDWVINLDADEALSPELQAEIRAVFADGVPPASGYTMQVCHMLPGEARPPKHTQINTCLRLYNKRNGRFSDSPVHDSVIMLQGEVRALAGPVYHRSYRSLSHAIEKINFYSNMQAEDLQQRGKRLNMFRLYGEFPIAFIKSYFIRGYIWRGGRGFIYAMLYAFSRFARLAKLHEFKKEQTS